MNGAGDSSAVEHPNLVRWVIGSIPPCGRVDIFHDPAMTGLTNTVVYAILYIKDPLLLIKTVVHCEAEAGFLSETCLIHNNMFDTDIAINEKCVECVVQ